MSGVLKQVLIAITDNQTIILHIKHGVICEGTLLYEALKATLYISLFCKQFREKSTK